ILGPEVGPRRPQRDPVHDLLERLGGQADARAEEPVVAVHAEELAHERDAVADRRRLAAIVALDDLVAREQLVAVGGEELAVLVEVELVDEQRRRGVAAVALGIAGRAAEGVDPARAFDLGPGVPGLDALQVEREVRRVVAVDLVHLPLDEANLGPEDRDRLVVRLLPPERAHGFFSSSIGTLPKSLTSSRRSSSLAAGALVRSSLRLTSFGSGFCASVDGGPGVFQAIDLPTILPMTLCDTLPRRCISV